MSLSWKNQKWKLPKQQQTQELWQFHGLGFVVDKKT